MKLKYFLLIISLTLGFTIQSQNSASKQPKTAVSIYTFSSLSQNINSISNLSKKLNLKNFQFAHVNYFNPNFNQFPFYFEDLSKNPSDLVYDFKRFQDKLIPREFLIENNPTLWNLQCPNPLSVQPTQ